MRGVLWAGQVIIMGETHMEQSGCKLHAAAAFAQPCTLRPSNPTTTPLRPLPFNQLGALSQSK